MFPETSQSRQCILPPSNLRGTSDVSSPSSSTSPFSSSPVLADSFRSVHFLLSSRVAPLPGFRLFGALVERFHPPTSLANLFSKTIVPLVLFISPFIRPLPRSARSVKEIRGFNDSRMANETGLLRGLKG